MQEQEQEQEQQEQEHDEKQHHWKMGEPTCREASAG
jgi:hypothetical protein